VSSPAAGGVKEIRLAVVCYGGVSLAVYMAGIARELHQLVLASRALDAGGEDKPFPPDDTRHAYVEALRRRSARDRAQVRVVVDVLAGSSAGGIDATFLAKALARDVPLTPLRQFWLEHGALSPLLPGRGPLQLKLGWFAVKALLRGGRVTPPVDGGTISRWFYDALASMEPEGGAAPSTTVPVGQSLDLFVTVTDSVGYRRFVSPGPGDPPIRDRSHRHVLRFRHTRPDRGPGEGQFGPADTGGLTFAARTTSSFPGAFPAVGLEEFAADLRPRPFDLDAFERVQFAEYRHWDDTPRASWFVDGGVLDNYPFGHALAAIDRKPAGSEVERYLVFVEPDPPDEPAAGEQRADKGRTRRRTTEPPPTWIETLKAGLVRLPGHEPVVDELLRLRRRNERVAQLAELPGDRTADVSRRLDEHAPDWRRGQFTYDEVRQVTAVLHEVAHGELGVGLAAYLRLRRQAVAETVSGAVGEAFGYPDTSSQAAFVREVCRVWLATRYTGDDEVTREFLRRFDLPFRQRRLTFVVQGINAWYGSADGPGRAELDEAKAVTYDALKRLWDLPLRMRPELEPAVTGLFDAPTLLKWIEREPQAFLDAHADALVDFEGRLGGWIEAALGVSAEQLWKDLQSSMGQWPEPARADLLARHLGFPLWDAAVLPVVGTSGVAQVAPVRVRRFSPVEATTLPWQGEKLRGVGARHFGAFLSQENRENDTLWGRLDGVELVLRLVDPQVTPGEIAAGLRAVLAEEDDLTTLKRGGRSGVWGRVEQALHKADPEAGA
jgi:patatin-related protein